MARGSNKSILFIVSTPIGNLGDISIRALEILKEVDVVAAEDTRHTKKIFSRYGIKTPLVSYYGAKEAVRCEKVIDLLASGKNVALVSDAGTPGISDPGYLLVRRAIDEGYEIITIPGPSAIISALTLSGIPTSRFVFEGFLPVKKGAREKRLKSLAGEERTIVIYESPRRVLRTLGEILEIMGDREAALARELTKIHEEVVRGKLSDIIERVEKKGIKGEVTLVIAGARRDKEVAPGEMESVIESVLKEGLSAKDAAEAAAKMLNMPKRLLYKEIVRRKDEN